MSILPRNNNQEARRYIKELKSDLELSIDKNKSSGTHKVFNNDDPYQIDINGFGAEVAFCKIANVYPDFTTHIRSGGEDCILSNGIKVDVKWTSLDPPRLLVKQYMKQKGDVGVYVLMIGEYPKYSVVGFASDDEVFNAPITNYGYGDNYTIEAKDLRPLEFLL